MLTAAQAAGVEFETAVRHQVTAQTRSAITITHAAPILHKPTIGHAIATCAREVATLAHATRVHAAFCDTKGLGTHSRCGAYKVGV